MDKRRINGPEISVKPIEKKNIQKNNKDDEIRKNNRSIDNIRPICNFFFFYVYIIYIPFLSHSFFFFFFFFFFFYYI